MSATEPDLWPWGPMLCAKLGPTLHSMVSAAAVYAECCMASCADMASSSCCDDDLAPQVRATWELLTSEFIPLELCSKLDPLLGSIAALNSPMSAASSVKDLHMDQYTTPLKQVRRGG